MTAITKLLPLFALLVTLVIASPEPRVDQLDDVKRQVEDHARQSRGDISDDSGQLERALHGEYLSGAKEDTLYCGPPGSPHCDVLQSHNTFPIHDHDHEDASLEARDRAGNSKFGSGNRAKGWKRDGEAGELEMLGDSLDHDEAMKNDHATGDMHDESMGDSKFGSANRAKGWKRDEDEGDDTGDSRFGSSNRAKGWKREEDEDEEDDTGYSKFGSSNRAKGWKREDDEDTGDEKFGSSNRAKGWKREDGDEDTGDSRFGSSNRAKGWKREDRLEEDQESGDSKFGSSNRAKGW